MVRMIRARAFLSKWRNWAAELKYKIFALRLAYKDPRVPWFAKAFGALVIAYALSPVDLIPDFIPILGYLDDLILLPLGIALAVKMIPPEIMQECLVTARIEMADGKRKNWTAGVIIIIAWILLACFVAARIFRSVSD
jgi:uncharacterized membrane protein YkvA (DUF1232 family)